jgi:hypothetical protein
MNDDFAIQVVQSLQAIAQQLQLLNDHLSIIKNDQRQIVSKNGH